MVENGIEIQIKERIVNRFKPTVKTIEKQTNCIHKWKDKDGSAYFRCKKCGYLADDQILDKLIFTMKLIEKGMDLETINKFI